MVKLYQELILTSILEDEGIPATFLTGIQAGIITTNSYSNAKIKKINPQKLKEKYQWARL